MQAQHDRWPYWVLVRFDIEEVPPEPLQLAAGSTATVVRGDVPCEVIAVPFGSRCSHAAHLVATTGTSTGYYRAVIVTMGTKSHDVRLPIKARWLTTTAEGEVEVQDFLGGGGLESDQ